MTSTIAQNNTNKFELGLTQSQQSNIWFATWCAPNASSVYLLAERKQANREKLVWYKVLKLTKQSDGVFTGQIKRKQLANYAFKIEQGEQTQIITKAQIIAQQSAFTTKTAAEPSMTEQQLLTREQLTQLQQGKAADAYKLLGAHQVTINQQQGVRFIVWAPNAQKVELIGDFTDWHQQKIRLNNLYLSGYWGGFCPQAQLGQCYKYLITSQHGTVTEKADPYAQAAEFRPHTASIIANNQQLNIADTAWLKQRANKNRFDAAISIYEVHAYSWRKHDNGDFLTYRELADQLIPYVLDLGFTHIQLLPVSEHPFDGSWGYQPTGMFAPSSRGGSAQDLAYFIEQCHQANIGVLFDWVPAHFPTDAHGLAQFDGSYLYEHEDPQKGFHPDWNTLIYNYDRNEVSNYLLSSAIQWLANFHIDGIRVDAVASMLYLDYSREAGQWQPNIYGGRENLEALAFIKQFNEQVYAQFPDVMTVAEESTAWPSVTQPTSNNGLGFGFKWNMGWMNDTLGYMQRDPIHRAHHHNELTFGLVYAFSEHYILPISHDEVVHGKGSMIAKMPGDAWQQFANLRAYYGFMWAHPGKKLLFMGCEFAQGKEWNHDTGLDWHQLDIHWHKGIQLTVKQLNAIYKNQPALYQLDHTEQGFEWLDNENAAQSIISFIRWDKHRQQPVVVIINFTPESYSNFRLGVPLAGNYQEIFNSDATQFAGSGQINSQLLATEQVPYDQQAQSIEICLPPLAACYFVLEDSSNG